MPRSNNHIIEYEQEIMRRRAKGYGGKEISGVLGFTIKQYKNFITR